MDSELWEDTAPPPAHTPPESLTKPHIHTHGQVSPDGHGPGAGVGGDAETPLPGQGPPMCGENWPGGSDQEGPGPGSRDGERHLAGPLLVSGPGPNPALPPTFSQSLSPGGGGAYLPTSRNQGKRS